MTKKEEAESEIREILKWFNEESINIYEKLNKEQGVERKLDGGNKPYEELHKKFVQRMTAVGEKYGLV